MKREDIGHIDTIVALMTQLNTVESVAQQTDNFDPCDEIRNEIETLPLSVCVMCLQPTPVGEALVPDTYEILLSTGGPAWRVTGSLVDNYADTVDIQHQDWGTPWTSYTYLLTDKERSLLLDFAQTFYFGQ